MWTEYSNVHCIILAQINQQHKPYIGALHNHFMFYLQSRDALRAERVGILQHLGLLEKIQAYRVDKFIANFLHALSTLHHAQLHVLPLCSNKRGCAVDLLELCGTCYCTPSTSQSCMLHFLCQPYVPPFIATSPLPYNIKQLLP